MRITVDNIMAAEPCEGYTRERVEALWDGRDALEPEEILALDIPREDIIWAMTKVVITDDRRRRLIACDITEEIALPIWEELSPHDWRLRTAVETSRRYVHGEATDEDLRAAWDATWSAARSAASYAASDAARSAAWYAAWYAARDADSDAASDAAWDAARCSAWEKIFDIVRRYLSQMSEENGL